MQTLATNGACVGACVSIQAATGIQALLARAVMCQLLG